MRTFLTGGTGFIGAHVLARLLETGDGTFFVLAREATRERLWTALQPHLSVEAFRAHAPRVELLAGDLTAPRLGLDDATYARAIAETGDVLHCAASLNRRSEKACLNVNLRGTLSVLQLARAAQDDHGLRRFSHVSTVAVAGQRQDECVAEDDAIDWARSDYDPYARTKKFSEHMVESLLPDVPVTTFRPSVVLGDSRRGATTQFDMVRSFVFLARLPLLPLRADHRIDIVPVDYVAGAIARLHAADDAPHRIYHLSAGAGAETYRAITDALAAARGKGRSRFAPWLLRPFRGTVSLLAGALRGRAPGRAAARLRVFLPYLTFNTVFDNARVAAAMGGPPPRFSEYCYPLLQFAREHDFRYPYVEYPG